MSAAQLHFPSIPSARVLSYGGGLDSWAMLLDCTERGMHLDAVVFADVADPEHEDPGEWPHTYEHVQDVVVPFCARRGIRFEILDSTRYPVRDARSLFAWLWARRQIPVANRKQRVCTTVAKVERFERWLDDNFSDQLVETLIGFEAGEEDRAKHDPNAGKPRKPRPGIARRTNRFPLIERGLCRCRCAELVRGLGYAVPSASACQFCPFGSRGEWKVYAETNPRHFGMTVELEARKPPTAAGKKLSIMDYRTLKDREGNVTGYRAPMLPEFIAKPYKAKPKGPCEVCGAPEKLRELASCVPTSEAA